MVRISSRTFIHSLPKLQICKADFSCPSWLSPGAKKLINRILDPNPVTVSSQTFVLVWNSSIHLKSLTISIHLFNACIWLSIVFVQRITIPEILEDGWFKKGYQPTCFQQEEDVNVDDVDAAFNNSEVRHFIHLHVSISLI